MGNHIFESNHVLNLPKPLISYSPSLDFYLSIIQTSSIDIRPWVFENYVDVVYKLEGATFICEFLDMMHHVWLNTPFLDCSVLDRGMLGSGEADIVSCIKAWIDREYYVLTMVNTSCVSAYSTFGIEETYHEMLIHGYTDDGFVCSDYFDYHLRSDHQMIPYSEFSAGYQNMNRARDYYKGILVAKVDHSVYESQSYESVDVPYLSQKLLDFLDNRPVHIHMPGFYHTKYGYKCGFAAFEVFGQHFLNGHEISKLIKPMHFFEQHINMMHLRIQFLCDEQRISKLGEDSLNLHRLSKRVKLLKLRMVLESKHDNKCPTKEMGTTLVSAIEEYKLILRHVQEILNSIS